MLSYNENLKFLSHRVLEPTQVLNKPELTVWRFKDSLSLDLSSCIFRRSIWLCSKQNLQK